MNPEEQLIQPTPTEPVFPTPPVQPVQPAQPTGQNMDVVPPPPVTPAPVEQPIQMPPYAPAQPPVSVETPVASPVAPEPVATTPTHHKTDMLGISSLIVGVIGLLPIGLVLGLVGASHAKKEHRSPVVSRIGWIINLVGMLVVIPVLTLLVLTNIDASQTKARDIQRVTDINNIEAKLEEYFADNFGYPNNLNDLEIDDKSLVGPNGSTIKVNDVASDEDEAKDSTDPT
ncbi:MAG: hypothetical protein AAB624_00090, partial [Patescibacteria group bacterium]